MPTKDNPSVARSNSTRAASVRSTGSKRVCGSFLEGEDLLIHEPIGKAYVYSASAICAPRQKQCGYCSAADG